MSGQGVWLRARERLRRFPELLAGCRDQAAAYGRCVAATTTGHTELRKDVCRKEFEALKQCFTQAVCCREQLHTQTCGWSLKGDRPGEFRAIVLRPPLVQCHRQNVCPGK
uniref:NADH:ubiquinone oxidoreductase complex assembly factor 8 n=1 Tax=Gopherus evgoodei TaxID=1825980 RepID=A0A8C4W779_9SAUR